MSSSKQREDEIDFDTLMENGEVGVPDRLAAENEAIIKELERKKRERKVAVPTNDGLVRARLREIGEPMTLFGEGAADRRDRLKYVLSQMKAAAGGGDEDVEGEESESESEDEDEEKEEEFYTIGSDALLEARQKIALYSLPRTARRLKKQKLDAAQPIAKVIEVRKTMFASLKEFTILGSQIGDTRPLSTLRFSPDSSMVATASWSGIAKVWNVPGCVELQALKGHETHVRGLAWHPQSTLSQSRSAVNLATGGGEGSVKMWSLESNTPLRTISGSTSPVARLAFHPSGDYLAGASFDGSWRLWDTESGSELIQQEGHSKEVFAIGWQDDGALVATGGLDAIGRVWDIRTGKSITVLDGHVQQITAIDFSPNGYQLATGSADDTIKIWDLRKHASIYTIPAHKSLVSDVKFFRSAAERSNLLESARPEDPDVSMDDTEASATTPSPISRSGLYLASGGYDATVKIWSADDWQLLRSVATDAGKVMGVDVSSDGKFIGSASSNRSFHLLGGEL